VDQLFASSTPDVILVQLVLVGAVVLFVLFMAFLFAVSLWERHPVKMLGDPYGQELPFELRYLRAAERGAIELGLIGGQVYNHPQYDVQIACWYSADRRLLVVAGQGKIMGAETKKSLVYSRLTNGMILKTTDNYDEGDHSGLFITKRAIEVSFKQLIQTHLKRSDYDHDRAVPFEPMDPSEAYDEIVHEQGERLVEMGRAYWCDHEEQEWRYNVFGACRVCMKCIGQFFFGLTQPLRRKAD